MDCSPTSGGRAHGQPDQRVDPGDEHGGGELAGAHGTLAGEDLTPQTVYDGAYGVHHDGAREIVQEHRHTRLAENLVHGRQPAQVVTRADGRAVDAEERAEREGAGRKSGVLGKFGQAI